MTNRTPSTRSPSDQLAVDQPTRDADRNDRTLLDESTQVDDNCLLPSLDTGLTLFEYEGGRGVPILQSLVLDHLLMSDGPAFWVDSHGYATTTSLARLTPSQRLLNRIHVARSFTVYQHFAAVRSLPTAIAQTIRDHATGDTLSLRRQERRERPDREPETSPLTPSLIVVPALDAHYRGADALSTEQAGTLQARVLARLSSLADGYDVPVLFTRTAADEFAVPIERAADQQIVCERTRMGPRFRGDEFETLVYPVGDGYYQTTFAYWRRVLAARADQVGLQPASPPGPGTASDGVGYGVTANGEAAALTANPLLDALTTTGRW